MAVIDAVRGDITQSRLDAIVNAANSGLMGGGGVDGAIHRAAGPELLEHCRALKQHYPDGFPVGHAAAVPAGRLHARWVIQTVGPNWHAGQRDPADLAACFSSSLREAVRVGARSVAFPAISAGVYGWDPAVVASTAVTTVSGSDFLPSLERVQFVLFSEQLLGLFRLALERG